MLRATLFPVPASAGLLDSLRRTSVALLLILICSSAASALPRKGEKSFGPRAGYVTRNNSALAGLSFDYAFSRHFRVAPSIGIFFRHEDLDALNIDIDAHFPIGRDGSRWTFYPLAGIGYQSWVRHELDEQTHDDVTTHSNCLGLNAGAGIDLRCNGNLKLGLEAKYTLIRHYPGAQLAARIAYTF